MKSVAIAALAASVTLSTQVFAAETASKFEGFSAEFATGYQQNTMGNGPLYVIGTGASAGASINSGSKNKVPAIIGLNYGFKLPGQFVLGVGLSYDLTAASITEIGRAHV